MRLYRKIGGVEHTGKIFTEEQLASEAHWNWEEVEVVLPDVSLPETLSEVPSYCTAWILFLVTTDVAKDLAKPADVLQPVVTGLREAVEAMPHAPEPPEDRAVWYAVPEKVANELRRWRDWAKKHKPKPRKKRTGRRRKTEQPASIAVMSALTEHHKYQSDGSIGCYEPATPDQLVKLSGTSKSSVSRYLTKSFGSKKAYEACCRRRGALRPKLAELQDDSPEGHLDLHPEWHGEDE